MKVGFIGLGHAGGKLAGTLLRNGVDLTVRDLDRAAAEPFLAAGAGFGESPKAMAEACDIVITCLPSPAASAAVMEGEDGILVRHRSGQGLAGDVDHRRRRNPPARGAGRGAGGEAVDCPVSGGVHRAATGNISILAGCRREVFERVLPVLKIRAGASCTPARSARASTLKVMTNYLATANLLTLCEALVTMKAAGMDLATTYEAIKIRRQFLRARDGKPDDPQRLARHLLQHGPRVEGYRPVPEDRREGRVPLEISPLMIEIFRDGQRRYGERANSDDIIRRLEEATGLSILAPGFPAEMVDDEPEEPGYEVVPPRPRTEPPHAPQLR